MGACRTHSLLKYPPGECSPTLPGLLRAHQRHVLMCRGDINCSGGAGGHSGHRTLALTSSWLVLIESFFAVFPLSFCCHIRSCNILCEVPLRGAQHHKKLPLVQISLFIKTHTHTDTPRGGCVTENAPRRNRKQEAGALCP